MTTGVAGQRVSLVTGGTGGIGCAVALGLARGGDRVLFVGRDAGRGERVLAGLREAAPEADHAFVPADLSLLSETARAADEVERLTDRLDAVVFCAGILSTVPEWTAEGLERSFVLNYLSRYLLARRLLPRLTEVPSGRLVLVSNTGVYKDTLDFGDLQYRRGTPGMRVSERTQFANDLLAVELAERLSGTRVEVTCVFLGVTQTAFLANARPAPARAHPGTGAAAPDLLSPRRVGPDAGLPGAKRRSHGHRGTLLGAEVQRARCPRARQAARAAQKAVGGQRGVGAAVPVAYPRQPKRSTVMTEQQTANLADADELADNRRGRGPLRRGDPRRGARNVGRKGAGMNQRRTPDPKKTNGWEAGPPLLEDIHHLTFVTADMDRLIGFYERVFGARVAADLEEEGLRHALIEVGPHTLLHPFQVPGVEPPGSQPMFRRGRLDHFALNAASEEAFWELHRRLAAEGSLDGEVTDMGSMLLFSFLDPDEGRHEVAWKKPGVPVEAGLRRAEWRTVELR